MWFLLLQIFILMLLAAAFGAALAWWWLSRRHEDLAASRERLVRLLGLSGDMARAAVLETAMPPMITAGALAISHGLAPVRGLSGESSRGHRQACGCVLFGEKVPKRI